MWSSVATKYLKKACIISAGGRYKKLYLLRQINLTPVFDNNCRIYGKSQSIQNFTET